MNHHSWNIRTKVLVTLALTMFLSIIVIVATFSYISNSLQSNYEALLNDKAYGLIETIRQMVQQSPAVSPQDKMVWMNNYLRSMVDNYHDISYAFITDKNLTVLYRSDENIPGTLLQELSYEKIQYDHPLFKPLKLSVKNYYEFIAPIVQTDRTFGTIHIGIRKELFDSKNFEMITISIITLMLAWGVASALIYWVLRRQIIQPITVLAEKADYVSRHHDLTQRIEVESHAEIGVLSAAFNAMIESLRQYHEQLNGEIQKRQQLEASLQVAKENAEAASRTKSQFLARMSHEIRTPMTAIIGMSDLLGETTLDHDQRDYISILQDSGEQLLSIINDILDFSRIEAGRVKLETTPFDLVDLVEGVARIMAPRVREKGLELAYRIAPGVAPHLLGDPIRLRQILINLLDNAVKFTAHGEVVIEVTAVDPLALSPSPSSEETERTCLRFSVRDTGIGIAPEQHASVFESFSQADISITREYSGSGLGLAICKRLVELMGGRIELHSEPGKGSEFFFTVAFARAATATKTDECWNPRHERALQQQRVLIVDDMAANRLLLHDYLGLWGAQVGMADNGRRAIEEIELAQSQGHAYTLVLMDIHMPEMDGLQATRALRERYPTPPPAIVVLTSGEAPDDREQLEALGIQGYLTKPVRRADLFDTLLTALGQSVVPAEPNPIRAGLPSLPAARILLVEDSATSRKVIQKFLQDSAVTLIEAVNGREAVNKATAEPFDLILMDLEMPEIDGLEATRRIRAWEAQTGQAPVPIVILTAHTFNEYRQQCQEAGSNDFLAKPVRKVELFRRLGEWLAPLSPLPPTPAAGRESGNLLSGVTSPSSAGEDGAAARLPPIKVRVNKFLQDLLPVLLNELTDARANMQQAVENGDFGDLRRLAHGYKGAAGNYELPTLARILLGLEQAALGANALAAAACLAEIDDYLHRLEVEYV